MPSSSVKVTYRVTTLCNDGLMEMERLGEWPTSAFYKIHPRVWKVG